MVSFMSNLPIPPELAHLIEKRLREEDRRNTKPQRKDAERREVDLGPLGAIESVSSIEELPLEERRAEEQRRQEAVRRNETRREED